MLIISFSSENLINKNVYRGLTGSIANRLQPLMPAGKKILSGLREIKEPFFNRDFYQHYKQYSFSSTKREFTLNESLYNAVFKKGLQELLRYADRNSMAHSREVRVPFLSHELIDFLFTLPPSFKIHRGWTKWLLRHSFKDILPEKICWRKDKIGYEPPQKNWLDNASVTDLIMTKRNKLISDKILHPSLASKAIQAHESADAKNNTWKIWMAGNLLT